METIIQADVPTISIIVPVYNVEKYLHRCIDSILLQSYTDFELLLVDDGSTDNSGKICDEYAITDQRIKVFHKHNGGVSSARNFGLDEAIGKWIAFVDSDDCITKSYLENLIKEVKSNDCIVISNYHHFNKPPMMQLENISLSKGNMVKYFFDHHIFNLSVPYAKLFNSHIINQNHIRYPLGIHMGEDGIFMVQYLNCISSAIIINTLDYSVNETEGSLSSKYYSFNSEWKCYQLWKKELLAFINRFGNIYSDPLKIVWENRISETFNRCLQCTYKNRNKNPLKEQVTHLKNIPETDYNEYSKYFTPKTFKKKILKTLIKYKMFFLYIIIGNCSFK